MKVHDRWTVTLMLTLVLSFASAGAAGSTGPHLPAALPAHGSCGADRVTVEPAAPTYRDPIRVTASGVWCDGCTPKYRSVRRDGNVIEVHGHSVGADPGISCITVLTPWSFTAEIGVLPAGETIVQIIVDGQPLSRTRFRVDGDRSFLPFLAR